MIVRAIRYCFSVFFLFAALAAAAQTGAYAELDSNYAETGNPFVIHLKITGTDTKPVKTDMSPWHSVLPKENILEQTDWSMNGQSYTQDLKVVFFDADTLSLPPLNIELANKAIATTNSLQIIVLPTPSPDDLVDMTGIKDIHREPTIWLDYLPWALAIAGLALLVIVASWLIGRAQKKRGIASRIVELPPHEMALKKLDVLKQKQLWQKGQVKAYCAEITYIVREYLEKRYQIPALESTSEEIVQHLKTTDFPDALFVDLQNILNQADLVKFARLIPSDHFHEDAFQFARKLVLATRVMAPLPDEQLPTDQTKS